MSGSRVLWGQITIVVVVVLAAIWGATEWTAWRLGFQGQLGAPWFELGGWPVYYPPLFFWWWYSYDAYAPGIFVEGAIIAASGGFLSIAVAVTLSIIRAREAKNVATYGSARWASPEEVTAAGLLGPDGVVLGRLDRDYLRHDGPEHVLCFAPTRSGKGVGLVVPTLLTWPGSVIVHDIKGENWGLTAGFRAGHGRVLLFDPTDAKSSAYNPLLEVRRGDWEVRDVQNIADILVDPEGALDKRNHWEKTSHSLLVGVILHVLYAEPDKTLAGVANFLSNRLILPNGRSIVLERQPGADAEGYAGLEDGVDYHWGELFKAAALSTLLSIGANTGSSSDESDLIGAIRDGASDSIGQTGRQIVQRQLNIAPTLTIRPGFPVRVIVTRDLVLEPYGATP